MSCWMLRLNIMSSVSDSQPHYSVGSLYHRAGQSIQSFLLLYVEKYHGSLLRLVAKTLIVKFTFVCYTHIINETKRGIPVKLKIDFTEPILSEKTVCEITTSDLNDFYVASSDLDKTNLFFVLLVSSHHYEAKNDFVKAAHLYFLTAFYLFTPLTPPGSYELSLHYINKAIALNPLPEYKEWCSLMEKGN